jgi:hypothetical protein
VALVVPSAPVAQARLVAAEAVASDKECPFCGEQIRVTAKKCKHCGETVDVSLRAAEEARRHADAAHRSGGGAAASTSVVVQGDWSRPFQHGPHLILTLFTCGFWLPVWFILALCHRG